MQLNLPPLPQIYLTENVFSLVIAELICHAKKVFRLFFANHPDVSQTIVFPFSLLNEAFLVLSNRKRFAFACLLLSHADFSLSSPKKCLYILLANHAGFSFISLKTTILLFCCLTTLFSAFFHRKNLICTFSANRAVSSFFSVKITYFLFYRQITLFSAFYCIGKTFSACRS